MTDDPVLSGVRKLDDHRQLHPVDANGLVLASIQALAARLEDLEDRIDQLTRSHDQQGGSP